MYFPSKSESPSPSVSNDLESTSSSLASFSTPSSAPASKTDDFSTPSSAPASKMSSSTYSTPLLSNKENDFGDDDYAPMDKSISTKTPPPAPSLSSLQESMPEVPPKGKTARCKKGTHRNKTTGNCDPTNTRKKKNTSMPQTARNIVLSKSKTRTMKKRIDELEHVVEQILDVLETLEDKV